METIKDPVVVMSSGTTKGVRRPVGRDRANIQANIDRVIKDTFLPPFLNYDLCLPLDHIFGITMRAVLEAKGVSHVVYPDLMRANPQGHVLITTPRLAKMYFRRGCPARFWISGSEPVGDYKPPHWCLIYEGYGTSETGVISRSTLTSYRRGSVGKPIVPTMIDAVGQIWVKPDGFKDFVNTKDKGHRDQDGFLYITRRN